MDSYENQIRKDIAEKAESKQSAVDTAKSFADTATDKAQQATHLRVEANREQDSEKADGLRSEAGKLETESQLYQEKSTEIRNNPDEFEKKAEEHNKEQEAKAEQEAEKALSDTKEPAKTQEPQREESPAQDNDKSRQEQMEEALGGGVFDMATARILGGGADAIESAAKNVASKLNWNKGEDKQQDNAQSQSDASGSSKLQWNKGDDSQTMEK